MDSQALAEVARRHGIVLVIRFGSTVSGQTHPASDIDLGVLFERLPQTLDEELRTIADLQALESGPVDVAVLNRAIRCCSSRSPTTPDSSSAPKRASTRSGDTPSSAIRITGASSTWNAST